MKFPGVVVGNTDKPMAEAENFVGKRKTVERKLAAANTRLREIRKQLGLSQESFAARLDIPTATLLSYEYGRTAKVPDKLLEAAEAISRLEGDVVKRNQASGERSMQEIIAEWAAELGVMKDDIKTISDVLGVSKSTVHRWKTGEMRPRPRELSGYTRVIKRMAGKFKSTAGES